MEAGQPGVQAAHAAQARLVKSVRASTYGSRRAQRVLDRGQPSKPAGGIDKPTAVQGQSGLALQAPEDLGSRMKGQHAGTSQGVRR